MVDFSTLIIGNTYDRPYLAKLWGYKSYAAIGRGVFTPKNQNIIIFFITKEKQKSLTPYEDHIEYDDLFWEGEEAHGNDERIIQRRDDIHVFYRERHHSDFTYEGRAFLHKYRLLKQNPSRFHFYLVDRQVTTKEIVSEIEVRYDIDQTEREALISARVGQGRYRKDSIRLWKTCCVTDFKNTNLLIASHIKPWKSSVNSERINPYNSLLLIPTMDRLFDKGYISFVTNGKIVLSDKIPKTEYEKIGVSKDLKLRDVPSETKKFLEYHNEYIFDMRSK